MSVITASSYFSLKTSVKAITTHSIINEGVGGRAIPTSPTSQKSVLKMTISISVPGVGNGMHTP